MTHPLMPVWAETLTVTPAGLKFTKRTDAEANIYVAGPYTIHSHGHNDWVGWIRHTVLGGFESFRDARWTLTLDMISRLLTPEIRIRPALQAFINRCSEPGEWTGILVMRDFLQEAELMDTLSLLDAVIPKGAM